MQRTALRAAADRRSVGQMSSRIESGASCRVGMFMRLAAIGAVLGYGLVGLAIYELANTGPPHLPVTPFVHLPVAAIVGWFLAAAWRRNQLVSGGWPTITLLVLAVAYVGVVAFFWVYVLLAL